jgi:hypothetical protein
MQVIFKKLNPSSHELRIIKSDKPEETTVLDTETYHLHDVCHFFVEQELKTTEGFWGMLAQGYRIDQLFGKTNELTEKLRIIECIVGGTQSVYSGHMSKEAFWNYMETVDWELNDAQFLEKVVPRIREFMGSWKYLPIGGEMKLAFNVGPVGTAV